MKFLHLIIPALFLIFGCSSTKNVEKNINTGNFNQAITDALNKLRKNKDKNPELVYLLQNAYNKANERDLNQIELLKLQNNSANTPQILETYRALDSRQNAVKAVLPLYANGKEVLFRTSNYNTEIANYKNEASAYIYDEAQNLLNSPNKLDARSAYNEFEYIEGINPNYRDVRNLMTQAYYKGTDYVLVSIENQSNQVIPRRLEDFLLDFNTYGLDKFWTVFHSEREKNRNYDYAMSLQLAQINISPEQLREKEFVREREIKDGWQYKLDRNGNVMKDSLGNDIKIDKFVTVRATVLQIGQFKTSEVIGVVAFKDLAAKKLLDRFPIKSQFTFENYFASYRGDKRALLPEDVNLINNPRVPFPPNEQMVFDCGEDLKQQLKRIIRSYKFQ
ncbi:hypothetical protein FJ651_12235 [Paucihalobacter ruber]|uniref:Lipoprotein n=1 Tax=Paucihalobacter ruber TaxID=2567861 RepID=A0A506PFF6_9FLAO|nr:hypothetical protein [Paucihalobacter ruber]TPV32329.1 hypothetical protein FJ651_12235 [Paucihalobacter ruber]